jgi:ribonucleoside-diphosphate reductase alpha chain
VRTCTSILDFIFRILGMEYLGQHDFIHVPPTLIDTRSDGNPLTNGHAANGAVVLPDSGQPAPKALLSGEKQAPGEKQAKAQAAAKAAAAHAERHGHHPDWKEPHDMLDEHLAEMMGDAPVCDSCGHLTVRNGSCYRCLSCGNSMGCS